VSEAGERQTNNIEITAFDARNEAARVSLDGIGAGFVMRFASGEIAGNFLRRERGEMHQSGFDKSDAFGVRKPNKRNAGKNRVGAAGESFEHVAGIVGRTRLAKNVAVESDSSVSSNNNGRADGARRGEFCFGDGETLDKIVRRFTGVSGFVNSGRKHSERKSSAAQDFGAPRRSRSENQFHRFSGHPETQRAESMLNDSTGRHGAQKELEFMRQLFPYNYIDT